MLGRYRPRPPGRQHRGSTHRVAPLETRPAAPRCERHCRPSAARSIPASAGARGPAGEARAARPGRRCPEVQATAGEAMAPLWTCQRSGSPGKSFRGQHRSRGQDGNRASRATSIAGRWRKCSKVGRGVGGLVTHRGGGEGYTCLEEPGLPANRCLRAKGGYTCPQLRVIDIELPVQSVPPPLADHTAHPGNQDVPVDSGAALVYPFSFLRAIPPVRSGE